MKIILLQDIAKIGKKHDVKELPNGYATHLARLGKVELATPGKLAQLESKKKSEKTKMQQQGKELAQAIDKIKESGVTITTKANEKGHLFEGITAVKLQEVIAENIVELPITSINLTDPIKEIGEHEIELVNEDVITKIKLTISASD